MDNEPDDRNSNVSQGLIAGVKVGVVAGLLLGAYQAFFSATLHGAGAGAATLGAHFLQELVFCGLVGGISGLLNLLCYGYDAARVGSGVGVAWAIVSFSIFLPFNFYAVFLYAGYGSAIGWACSHVEKRRRGLYSEL